MPIEDVHTGVDADQIEAFVHGLIRAYRRTLSPDRRRLLERYRYVHAARKVVGVGSVGTRAWIVLMLGRDDNDPLFLQLKEAQASVLEPFLGKSTYAQHGQRVVEGQRLTQAASDIMLGWIKTDDADGVSRHFYMRQLWDGKGSAIVESMDPKAMTLYAQLCGWSLAKAHARSGDAIAIGSYLGGGESFDRALASFAEAYADQNERDYDALSAAVASGRVVAEPAASRGGTERRDRAGSGVVARDRGARAARRRRRVSRRLQGTPRHAGDGVRRHRPAGRPQVLDEIDLDSSGGTVRTLAEATLALVLFCDASRVDSGSCAARSGSRSACSASGCR